MGICEGFSQVGDALGEAGQVFKSYAAECSLEKSLSAALDECPTDVCAASNCGNNGVCRQIGCGAEDYKCDCNYGYEGVNCENEKTFCDSNPCQNGGVCKEGENYLTGAAIVGYTCECVNDFSGSNCQEEPFFRFEPSATLNFNGIMTDNTANIESIRSTVGAAMSALDGTAGLISSIVNTVEITNSDSTSTVDVMLTCVVQGTSFTARRRKRNIEALQSASNNALQQVGSAIATDMSSDGEVISMTSVEMDMPEFSEWEKPDNVSEMCVDYCKNGGQCEIVNPFAEEKECDCQSGYIGETCSEKRTTVLELNEDTSIQTSSEQQITTSSEAGLGFGMLVGLGVLFYCI